MFQPAIFQEDRLDVMHDLMRTHPFATLVSSVTGELTADHIPLVLHDDEGEFGILRGHVAAGNPLFTKTKGALDVLAVFQGPQTYITPSWYASKKEHGKVVPTWNYAVVHARGTLTFNRDENWLLRHLHDLTKQHEGHRPNPWAVSDAPDEFVKGQLRGLVGFEIQVSNLHGKWKVSQNKNHADKSGVATGLLDENTVDASEISKFVTERAQ